MIIQYQGQKVNHQLNFIDGSGETYYTDTKTPQNAVHRRIAELLMEVTVMWATLILLSAVVLAVGSVWLTTRVAKFGFIRSKVKSKTVGVLIGLAVIAVFFALFCLLLGMMNALVIFLNIIAIWLICEAVALIYRKILKKERTRYICGIVAVCVSAVYLTVGYFFAVHVFRTEYNIGSSKDVSLKIVGFSDSHIGAVFSGKKLGEYVERINGEAPDIVVIVGDFVDDGTTEKDMRDACEALGKLKAGKGVYFVFGNHDGGYMRRSYGSDELVRCLEENGVQVLRDTVVSPTDGVSVIGRKDKGDRSRKAISELIENGTGYSIVLDHQPNDYSAEAEAGADLVISGHTHGGQLLPIIFVGELIGANDATYGHEKRGSTDFIVSSGIADWELIFKTGCLSEYFVINVN